MKRDEAESLGIGGGLIGPPPPPPAVPRVGREVEKDRQSSDQ